MGGTYPLDPNWARRTPQALGTGPAYVPPKVPETKPLLDSIIVGGVTYVYHEDPITGEVTIVDAQKPKTGSGGGGGGGASGPTALDYSMFGEDQRQFNLQFGLSQTQADRGFGLDQAQFGLSSAQFDWQKQQQAAADARAQTAFQYQVAADSLDRQYRDNQAALQQSNFQADLALRQGDMKLAQQRQADSVRLQQQSLALEAQSIQARAAADQAQAAAAMAGVEAQREGNQLQFQLGSRGLDVESARNADLLNIANMDDATRKMLGLQSNQTGQFSAETDRAAQMGRLDLDTKQFILDKSQSARNLPSLFFMQRGINPDWDAIMAGGAPPTGVPVEGTGTAGGLSFQNQYGTPEANIAALQQQIPLAGGALAPGMSAYTPTTAAPSFDPGAYGPSSATPPPVAEVAPGQPVPSNAVGEGGGEDNQAANEITRQMQEARNVDAQNMALQTARYGGINRDAAQANQAAQMLAAREAEAQMYAQNEASRAMFDPVTGYKLNVPRAAEGGYHAGPAIVGDSPSGRPTGHEEMVMPMMTPDGRPAMRVQPMNREGMEAQMRLAQMGGAMPRFAAGTFTGEDRYETAAGSGAYSSTPSWYQPATSTQPQPAQQASATPAPAVTPQQSYEQAGMGGQYVPTSNNTYAQGQNLELPKILQMLAANGYPINPALLANMTGTQAPNLNVAGAVAQRGGGVLASLQSLRNQTQSERDEYSGVIQGVSGTPWGDVENAIRSGTANLRRAQRAQ